MAELSKVKKYIEEYKMIEKRDSVIVGLSGGADSVCLLDMLSALRAEYELEITAVHVHHGIRGAEADRDMKFAEKFCRERDINLKVFYYDVPNYAKENGMSEEEAGRKLRYDAFESLRRPGGKIAVAHNLNDSVETFIHNLCRGSGIAGLTGIKPVNGHIIRPVLCLERKEIENYLDRNQIRYIHDSTNFDDGYTRNKIRLNVLPYLMENINSESILHINNAAQELCEAERFLNEQTVLLYNQVFSEHNNCIYADKKMLRELDSYMQRRTIRLALQHLAGKLKDITRQHVTDIVMLSGRQSGRYIMLPYGIMVRAEQEYLVFERQQGNVSGTEQEGISVLQPGIYEFGDYIFEIQIINVEEEEEILKDFENYFKKNQKLCTKWFSYDKIKSTVQLRYRQSGDYLTINSDDGKKKLKSYMIDEKIPVSMRDKIPVLADGAHVMWVFGYRMSEWYKVTAGTKRILKITGRNKLEDAGQN